jgi:hypothetical protein
MHDVHEVHIYRDINNYNGHNYAPALLNYLSSTFQGEDSPNSTGRNHELKWTIKIHKTRCIVSRKLLPCHCIINKNSP